MTDQEIRAAAARGATWLDRRKRGWHRMVVMRELVICDCSMCVLGQVFGDYIAAVGDYCLTNQQTFKYGFSLLKVWESESYPLLRRAWLREIRRRRAADAKPKRKASTT